MAKTTKPNLTMAQMERRYATDEACKALLAKLRWPAGQPVCPRCGEAKKVYKTSAAFRWKCKACNANGYRFSVLTGTVFENTNVPLRTWFKVAYLMVSSKKGISALQVHRMIDPVRGSKGSYKTAWYMCHRIRAAMQQGGGGLLGGIVEVDETYVGGSESNKHVSKRRVRGRAGFPHMVPVVGAIARKGNVTCKMIARASAAELTGFVREVVDPQVSLIATDQNPAYHQLSFPMGLPHETVNHNQGEYVRGVVHTANLDSFWSLLKRGIMGSFHHVSVSHLPLYLNEFAWRHNNRHNPDIFHAVLAGC